LFDINRIKLGVMELLIASRNTFKIGELRRILEEMLPSVRIRSLLEFPDVFPPTFEHQSFEQNAVDKALFAAQMTKLPCVGDESGLIVPYFGGYLASMKAKTLQTPGKRLPNSKKILSDLQGVDDVHRSAFLECAIAFACPEKGMIKVTSSRLEGYIAASESGPASFDFASIFVKNEYSKTLASLPQSVFERISHRRKACEKLRPAFRSYFVRTE
jgi:XTP/dITP diphosphohydrolase